MDIRRSTKAVLAGIGIAMFATAATAKTLVFCSDGSPEGFDPALHVTSATFDASSKPLYNRLVEFKRGTTELVPGLAESWSISEDGREYTFNLRKGVKFHTVDGFAPTRDFNADDVVYSLARQLKTRHPWHAYIAGANWEYFNGMSMPDLIRDIVKVDDHTVKLVLRRAEAPVIANLAMDFASILSAEYAAKLEAEGSMERMDRMPVGTGPFRLVSYRQDVEIRYQAFADHWAGAQPIDGLVFAITADASERLRKLKSGACHVAPSAAPEDIAGISADPDLVLREQTGLTIGYLAYNTRQAPFDNPSVRKALNIAIDKQAILDTVFRGTGEEARTPIPPAMWSHNRAIENDPHDPDLARKMLAEEGVTDLSMKIWAMPVPRSFNPDAHRVAEAIQTNFAAIGVSAEIVSYGWGEYLRRSKALDREGAVLFGWASDNGDPDAFLAGLLGCDAVGGSNRAQWCHRPFDDLVQKAKTVNDPSERAGLYRQAQAIFKDQAPWATIAHSRVIVPMSSKVTGYVVDPFGGHRFDGVDIRE